MRMAEKIGLALLLSVLGLVSLWLQFALQEDTPPLVTNTSIHEPNYYVENFTAIGMNEKNSRTYLLEAKRMAHYQDDNTALLDIPHLIQYQTGLPPRHVYAESGWLSGDGKEILLTGNVRVIQGQNKNTSGGIQHSDKMRIHLEPNSSSLRQSG